RWDRVSKFRVQIAGGALASLSELRVLAGGNAAAVQTLDGGWEILQFANAELIDGNIYRLSHLLRGQLGSDSAMRDLVPAGARFVLLDTHLVPIARGLSALGRSLRLRVVASGRSHDDASAVDLTATPGLTALRPLAPVHLSARRTADGVRIGWIRRTRLDGDGWGVEVPLGEDSEAYAVDILGSGGAVVRTMQTAVPQALYAAADERADFGAAQASLTLRVAQLSATVGPGFAATATFAL
ncbi:hypothetical protein DYI24_27295, partial [Rhodopseudomonas sp. BR0C11]|nr:hypothetical protein [Rhodopseudomonas sp. BR0C11]